MIFEFGGFELDTALYELRCEGAGVPLEPQTFNLLRFLIENRDRTVTRDEIVEEIWQGRVISEAALSTAIKAVRRAIGDSGQRQTWIKTIRGRGFRFVGRTATRAARPAIAKEEAPTEASPSYGVARPSIVALPFDMIGRNDKHPALSEALAHDVIQALSRLRSLRVIARGTAFRFRAGDGSLEDLKAKIDVRYCLTGAIELAGAQLIISVELIDLALEQTVWVDRFEGALDDVHALRSEIVSRTAASIEARISQHQAQLARGLATERLDAWSAFHLGLANLYQFNAPGVATAIELLNRAIVLDPNFARAHAGLSSAHFQNAFNAYDGVDLTDAARQARAAAERGLELDPLDPFCNFVQARVFWMSGDVEQSLGWLDQATSINPNFAQGHYAKGLAALMANAPFDAHPAANLARSLSPLDPFLYGFFGVHAFAFISEGDYAEAARWANRAASAPGALVVMDLVAVVANDLAGDRAAARQWARRARERRPGVDAAYFFRALPFRAGVTREAIRQALSRHAF